LAIAVFGALLSGVFQRALTQRLDPLGLPAVERRHIEAQRPRLAAIDTSDERAGRAIAEAFIAGYGAVIWGAVGLALASSLSAAVLISPDRDG
jgi:hypothetical protein